MTEEVDADLGDAPLNTLRDRGHFLVLDKPFVRIGDFYYLLSTRALDNTLGLGVFYAAMDAKTGAAGADNEARLAAAKEFGGVAGLYYEEYAGERVRRIAERSRAIFRGEVLDDEQLKSSDFFVLEDDKLVVFEMHHGRVARPVVEGLDPKRISKTFERVLYAKVEQLDRNVRKFGDGRLVIPGIDRNRVRRVYPLVCLPSEFPRNAAIQKKIDTDLVASGWLGATVGALEVAPLEIIDSESLEGLDGLGAPVSFSSLIDDKTADPRTRVVFFKNFLVSVKGMRLKMDSEDQRGRAKSLEQFTSETDGWIAD
jgi:hypothetical protein